MQFNPLFLNESGNTKSLVTRNNKMQSNKYLFSDIVKVVMDDEKGNTKLKNISIDEKTDNEFDIIENTDLITQELQTKIITNSENEKMKLQLADILPPDMAELLINDNITISNEKAISFVGKEQLKGELKKFITSLVSDDVIEANVSNSKGLLLRLEDSKSAVNIEIRKELNAKISVDKLVVQAMVVPEKFRIQTLTNSNEILNQGNDTEGLKKTNIKFGQSPSLSKTNLSNLINTQVAENTIKPNVDESLELKSLDTTKPTLRVFSFDTKNTDNIRFNMDSNKKLFNHVIKMNDSNLKQAIQPNNEEQLVKEKGDTFSTQNIHELDTSINRNIEKKYNVSQITIVKKQPILLDETKQSSNDSNTKVDAKLSKVDFNLFNHNKIKNIIAKGEISEPVTQNKKNDLEIKAKNIKVENNIVEPKIISNKTNLKGKEQKEIGISKIVKNNKIEEKLDNRNEIIIEKTIINKQDGNVLFDKSKKIVSVKEEIKSEVKTKEIKNVELPNEIVSKGKILVQKKNKKVSVKIKKGLKLSGVKDEQENIHVNNLNNKITNEFDTNPDLSQNQSQNILNSNTETNSKVAHNFHHKFNSELVNTKDEARVLQNDARQQNSERIVKAIEVVKEISRFITKQDKGTLSFKISPEHLGKLKITLETTEHNLTANIQVENEQAKQLVEKNINILQTQLKESGVELGSLNISFGNPKGNKDERTEEGNTSKQQFDEVNIEETINEKENRSLGYNTYEYLA